MNVRIVVLVVLLVVLGGCLGWEPAQVQDDPIVDVKTDEEALGYDDQTPDISGIESSPPTPVEGVDEPTPGATDTATPATTPTSAVTPNDTSTEAGDDATATGTTDTTAVTATTNETMTAAPNETGTTTPIETATPVGTTDVPAGDEPTPASTDDE